MRDAPGYLGMSPRTFNAVVRPYLTELPVGDGGIGWDRLDLDAWVDEHKRRNGRPATKLEDTPCQRRERRADSESAVKRGISRKPSADSSFAKALERVTSRKRNVTSR
jgi:hypothetical protein